MAFLPTIAEQLCLVVADQIDELRLALARVRDLVRVSADHLGHVPRCIRCRELIHEPQPIVAGRCWPCEHVVDSAADGRVEG